MAFPGPAFNGLAQLLRLLPGAAGAAGFLYALLSLGSDPDFLRRSLQALAPPTDPTARELRRAARQAAEERPAAAEAEAEAEEEAAPPRAEAPPAPEPKGAAAGGSPLERALEAAGAARATPDWLRGLFGEQTGPGYTALSSLLDFGQPETALRTALRLGGIAPGVGYAARAAEAHADELMLPVLVAFLQNPDALSDPMQRAALIRAQALRGQVYRPTEAVRIAHTLVEQGKQLAEQVARGERAELLLSPAESFLVRLGEDPSLQARLYLSAAGSGVGGTIGRLIREGMARALDAMRFQDALRAYEASLRY